MAKSNTQILSAMLRECEPSWANRIPKGSVERWETAHLLATLPDFLITGNEIYESLIERIGLTILRKLETRNQFGVFKTADSLLLGKHTQEIAYDIVKAVSYEGIPGYGKSREQDQFAPNINPPKAAYHTINRREFFPTTLEEIQLRTAFTDMYGLNNALAEQIAVLYNSDEVNEVVFSKKAFADTFNGKAGMKLQNTQIVEVPDVRENQDKSAIAQFITTVRKTLWDMTFNKSCYNMAGITKAVSRGDMVFCIPADVAVNNEVNFLAQIFNEQLAGIGQQTVITDDFGEGGEDIIAVACGSTFLNIRTVFSALTTAGNAVGLYTNKFWHHHQIYEVSPFSNVVFFKAKK